MNTSTAPAQFAMSLLPSHRKLAPLKRLLVVAGVTAVAVVWSWKDHQDTLALAAVQQTDVARLLEIHAFHVISKADAVLDRVQDEVRDHDIMGQGADQRWHTFGQIASKLPVSGRLWLYRADGSAVMASHLRHSKNNANDRAYFNAQKEADVGLFIGETVVGKTTGNKVFNLSRRIDAPDGSFAGVAMAAIDIDVFTQAVKELNVGKSAAFLLVRSDGAVIMRYPDEGTSGQRIDLARYLPANAPPNGLIRTTETIDGQERQLAYRTHPTLALTTVVSLSSDEVLAPWRQRTLMRCAFLAALLLLGGALTMVTQTAARREARAAKRMQTVLATVGDGLCGLDAQGHIAFINPAGAHLLGYQPDELAGKPFQALTRLTSPTTPTSTPSPEPASTSSDPINHLIQQGGEGGEHVGCDTFGTKDGSTFAAQYTATRVNDLDGQPGVVIAFRDVSAVLAAQNALRDQKEFVTTILDSLSEHIAVVDGQGVITAVNAAWRRFAAANGAASDAAVGVGTNYLEVCAMAAQRFNTPESIEVLAGIRAVLSGEQPSFSQQYPCHGPQTQRWFVQHALPLQGKQGAVIIHQNITDNHQADTLLRESETRYRLLADKMADIVWKTDAHLCLTYINEADQRLRGFDRNAVLGRHISHTLTPEGQAILAKVMQQHQPPDVSQQPLRFELPQVCHDGAEVWVEVTAIAVHNGNGDLIGYQGIGRDVTTRKQAERQRQQEQQQLQTRLAQAAQRQLSLQELANRDPLTGVYNRRYFNEVMPQELLKAERDGYSVAVIMLDLDHFKHVNDTHGHAAGDEVLKALAGLLKRRAREGDIVCRHGGEEFVVAMTHMPIDRARVRLETWRVELANMHIQHGQTVMQVTFSAGLTAFPAHGADLDTLLRRADELLYRSKNEGRNRVSADSL